MQHSIYDISLLNLLWVLLPVGVVVTIYVRWALSFQTVLYAIARMLLQLFLIGFVLIWLFEDTSVLIPSLVLALMLAVASWIAIRPIRKNHPHLYKQAFLALLAGCSLTLTIVIFGVLKPEPWHEPRYLIPIAGMIFSNAMNSVSLAAERFVSERAQNISFKKARNAAFETSLLPLLNSFFAVGLVSLPGMMTGQILSGVSPLIAVRYQIMVMCMLLGSSGISSAVYLALQKSGMDRPK